MFALSQFLSCFPNVFSPTATITPSAEAINSSLRRLLLGQYLDDIAVGRIGDMIATCRPGFAFMNPQFMAFLKAITPAMEMYVNHTTADTDIVFIPYCSNEHWMLFVVNIDGSSIVCYDSSPHTLNVYVINTRCSVCSVSCVACYRQVTGGTCYLISSRQQDGYDCDINILDFTLEVVFGRNEMLQRLADYRALFRELIEYPSGNLRDRLQHIFDTHRSTSQLFSGDIDCHRTFSRREMYIEHLDEHISVLQQLRNN